MDQAGGMGGTGRAGCVGQAEQFGQALGKNAFLPNFLGECHTNLLLWEEGPAPLKNLFCLVLSMWKELERCGKCWKTQMTGKEVHILRPGVWVHKLDQTMHVPQRPRWA